MAKFLFAAIILCVGACAVMSQDSTPAAGADLKGFWQDSATGLTWAVNDNGSSVSSNQANDYCSSLRSGGYSDWRLPKIEELETLYDSKLSKGNKIGIGFYYSKQMKAEEARQVISEIGESMRE